MMGKKMLTIWMLDNENECTVNITSLFTNKLHKVSYFLTEGPIKSIFPLHSVFSILFYFILFLNYFTIEYKFMSLTKLIK